MKQQVDFIDRLTCWLLGHEGKRIIGTFYMVCLRCDKKTRIGAPRGK